MSVIDWQLISSQYEHFFILAMMISSACPRFLIALDNTRTSGNPFSRSPRRPLLHLTPGTTPPHPRAPTSLISTQPTAAFPILSLARLLPLPIHPPSPPFSTHSIKLTYTPPKSPPSRSRSPESSGNAVQFDELVNLSVRWPSGYGASFRLRLFFVENNLENSAEDKITSGAIFVGSSPTLIKFLRGFCFALFGEGRGMGGMGYGVLAGWDGEGDDGRRGSREDGF